MSKQHTHSWPMTSNRVALMGGPKNMSLAEYRIWRRRENRHQNVIVRVFSAREFCAVHIQQLSSSARLAQSVEHEALNLRVVGSSPTVGGLLFFSFYLLLLALPVRLPVCKQRTNETRCLCVCVLVHQQQLCDRFSFWGKKHIRSQGQAHSHTHTDGREHNTARPSERMNDQN